MRLSQSVQKVQPSTTLAVTAKAKAMRKAGVDVVALSAGEPDFDTPENIKEAAQRAMARGETKYTPVPGHPALRQAVAEKTTRTYDIPADPQQVIVSTGGKQVLFNAFAALLDPGDEVLIGAPYWVSYPDMVRFAGAHPVILSTDEGQGFLPKAPAIADAITDRTRLLVLNSPANPTGATYKRDDLEAIAEVLRGHPDVFVVSDDIYEALVYDEPFVSLLHVAPDLRDRTLIASGVSKTYAMTGWRIGFGIGPQPLIDAMSRLQGASTSGPCSIAQAAAIEALVGDQSPIDALISVFKQRRERIVAALRDIPNIEVFQPGGAFYVFPRVNAYYRNGITTSQALCEYLLEEVHLAVVPGSAFGSDDHVRLSFAYSGEQILDGVGRMRDGLTKLA